MIAGRQNSARQPFMFGPWWVSKYGKIYRGMAFIWSLGMCLWALFGPSWSARKYNWEPLTTETIYESHHHCIVINFTLTLTYIPSCQSPENDTNALLHLTPTHYLCNAGFRLACRSPLCRYAVWSSLAVSELQLSAATPLWPYHRAASLPSWIEFNCLRSAAVGKAAKLSIYWHDAACYLVILCGKWRLRSCTKITINAAMRRAAS